MRVDSVPLPYSYREFKLPKKGAAGRTKPFRAEACLIKIRELIPNLKENTTLLYYKDQLINSVERNEPS
jgi:hypothetical protein